MELAEVISENYGLRLTDAELKRVDELIRSFASDYCTCGSKRLINLSGATIRCRICKKEVRPLP